MTGFVLQGHICKLLIDGNIFNKGSKNFFKWLFKSNILSISLLSKPTCSTLKQVIFISSCILWESKSAPVSVFSTAQGNISKCTALKALIRFNVEQVWSLQNHNLNSNQISLRTRYIPIILQPCSVLAPILDIYSNPKDLDQLLKVLAHRVRNVLMHFLLSYQNACYGCENAENLFFL